MKEIGQLGCRSKGGHTLFQTYKTCRVTMLLKGSDMKCEEQEAEKHNLMRIIKLKYGKYNKLITKP